MNKHRNRSRGYTIVEVMIFLAVSGALLTSAMLLLSGQQQRQEFYQASRDADSKIQDVINDFATGYFPGTDQLSCTADDGGNAPVINAGTSEQGSRVGCSFIGKVIQFAPDGFNSNGMKIITVVGRQYEGAPLSDLIENIVDARPTPVINPIDLSEDAFFGYGLTVGSVTFTDTSNTEVPIGAIGFFSSFADNLLSGAANGKQTTQVVVIPSSSLNDNNTAIENDIKNIKNIAPNAFQAEYTNRPIRICLLSAGSNQRAILTLGDNNRQIATNLSIEEGNTC